ncbi:hypothetical protein JW711_06555 [Candidatus Woesearchaeota archaeon]|nr:hypothetical protein [Candidatus Woesearchaeota archaeon]
MDLKNWTVHHIKQKDLVKRDLVSFQEEDGKITCEYKESHATFFMQENLDLNKVKSLDAKDVSYLVCLCNEHNFKLLADNWNLLKTLQNLTFIFLNPEFTDKWIIKPFVHAKIADPKTLKQGLRTMYDTCMGKI